MFTMQTPDVKDKKILEDLEQAFKELSALVKDVKTTAKLTEASSALDVLSEKINHFKQIKELKKKAEDKRKIVRSVDRPKQEAIEDEITKYETAYETIERDRFKKDKNNDFVYIAAEWLDDDKDRVDTLEAQVIELSETIKTIKQQLAITDKLTSLKEEVSRILTGRQDELAHLSKKAEALEIEGDKALRLSKKIPGSKSLGDDEATARKPNKTRKDDKDKPKV